MSTPQITETPVVLPSLGDNVTEAVVTRWLKSPGDPVEAEEPLLEVATDKVDTEIPAPVAGTLTRIIVEADRQVAIGTPLAMITPEHGAAQDDSDTPPRALPAPDPPEPHSATPDRPASPPRQTPADASPPAAQPPSEPRTPTQAAPERSHTPPAPVPAPDAEPLSGNRFRVERLPRIRQTIARRMLDSLHTSAQLTTVVEADVTSIAHLRATHRDEFRRQHGIGLSFLPFFAKAAIESLARHPVINARLDADCTEVTYHHDVHLGMAVDSPKGLMVPVIANAHHLGIAALAHAIARHADDVRGGRITPDALSGGTFTITNTGSRGALFDTPIINQPQSAILGVGAVVDRVVPSYDEHGDVRFGVRSMSYLSLSYDHRIVDGADAARYLGDLRRRLESGFTAAELR